MHLEGANIESMKEWYQDRLLAINTNITNMQDVEKQVMSVKLMEAKLRQQLNWGDEWDYQSTDINHREWAKGEAASM